MLHAKTGENLHLPVIHLHGHGYLEHSLGSAQDLAKSGIELQKFRRHVELKLRNSKRVQVFP
jgi:hypothetical protein